MFFLRPGLKSGLNWVKKFHRGWLFFGVILFLFLLFLLIDAIFPFRTDKVVYSRVIYASDSTLLHGFLSSDQKWRLYADEDEITPDLRRAFIVKEDRWFYFHPGVNPLAVIRAAWNNLSKGHRTSGASTITMQLARLLDPAPRTIRSKFREMFRALQLEWHYSKDEILLYYLNLLPYGGNIEGVKAASLIYFGQSPLALSPAQVVMLTVIPNDPNSLRPGNNYDRLLQRRNHWIVRMKNDGIFNQAAATDALSEPFERHRYPVPSLAPHLALRLSGRPVGEHGVITALKPAIQERVEGLVKNHVRLLRTMQITNAAVLVVNNRTMEVEAYLGSAGFSEDGFQGQVDGIRALRSPGSALKPLLYALAFDQGIVSPKMVITDVPANFNGYRPENFDETYRGEITVEQALALSLNVPAVNLLDKLGGDIFIHALAKSGFRWIGRNGDRLGLSVVLGGCGSTLEELTTLYAGFANGGIVRQLKYIKQEDGHTGDTICSPGAAYMITQILTGLKRPDLPGQYQASADLPKIAWKTGTSYGRRDGWAIGYNRDYTVGVWTGNFPGNGIPELNGADCAVPLLFNIFRAISPANRPDWFAPPEDLDFRLVCSESGMPPDTFCHHVTMDYFLPGISPSTRCNHLQRQYVNVAGTISYCRSCLPDKGYKEVLYPYYPADLISWYNEMQIPYEALPPHNPQCPAIHQGDAPLITSLTDGAEYLLIFGRKQQLMLSCNAENGVSKVYWYLNDHFYKAALPNEKVFFTPEAGSYKISCSDDRGRNSDVRVKVTFI
ncbi:MAG: penicillin-binding protein 1C [Bacteroidales bacterium]|nr:penicillin-binding protein 1C [Bacteroidales bacterium]